MSVTYYLTVFGAGILSFLSPCVLPLFPLYMGTFMGETGDKKVKIGNYSFYLLPVLKVLAFMSGISLIFFMLGFAASFLGQIVYGHYTRYVLGGIIVLMGIYQLELVEIPWLSRQKTVQMEAKNAGELTRSFLLGLSFSFGWTPCVGPVLSSVLALVTTTGASAWYGGSLLFVYALGLSVPFLLLAVVSSSLVKWLNVAKQHMMLIKRVGAVLIILVGILVMFNKI